MIDEEGKATTLCKQDMMRRVYETGTEFREQCRILY
jgi:hypothetical protein